MIKLLTVLTLLFARSICFSQNTCDSLTLLKRQLYGFKPAELTDSLKDLKSQELNRFWNLAHDHLPEGAKCVAGMIKNETKDSYFCFDASSLLLRLDTSDIYLPTVIEGLKKCDLADIQLSSYLQICYYLGYRGQDISDLTKNLISIPNAQVYLEAHVITLNAVDAGIFLINLMSSSQAEDMLRDAILHGNPTARHNSAILLNLVATDRGDSLLTALKTKKILPDSTIEYIEHDRMEFIIKPEGTISRDKVLEDLNDAPYNIDKDFFGFAGSDDLIGSACKQLTKADIDKIREARRKSTPGLSDEALHEYYTLTSILETVRNKSQ